MGEKVDMPKKEFQKLLNDFGNILDSCAPELLKKVTFSRLSEGRFTWELENWELHTLEGTRATNKSGRKK